MRLPLTFQGLGQPPDTVVPNRVVPEVQGRQAGVDLQGLGQPLGTVIPNGVAAEVQGRQAAIDLQGIGQPPGPISANGVDLRARVVRLPLTFQASANHQAPSAPMAAGTITTRHQGPIRANGGTHGSFRLEPSEKLNLQGDSLQARTELLRNGNALSKTSNTSNTNGQNTPPAHTKILQHSCQMKWEAV